jgi:hypothetical protein
MNYRCLLPLAALLGAQIFWATGAGAVSVRTKFACLGDFRTYCGEFKVGSSQLRSCMNANGPKLSKKCVNALIADGEISEAEVARRAATSR